MPPVKGRSERWGREGLDWGKLQEALEVAGFTQKFADTIKSIVDLGTATQLEGVKPKTMCL